MSYSTFFFSFSSQNRSNCDFVVVFSGVLVRPVQERKLKQHHTCHHGEFDTWRLKHQRVFKRMERQ